MQSPDFTPTLWASALPGGLRRCTAEQQHLEAERERIRQEEAARADREARAKLEAEQQAVLIVSPPAPSARTSVPTLRIGTIKERLLHMSVTAEDLRALGFEPAGRERAAPLYHEEDFPAICEAIAARALAAKAQFLRDLAVVAA